MKLKPILADPLNMDRAGVTTCKLAATFVHIGRCGLVGTTIPSMTRDTGINGSTLTSHFNILQELKLITPFARTNAKGRAVSYCVTVKGWEVLTRPADFSMFQQLTRQTA